MYDAGPKYLLDVEEYSRVYCIDPEISWLTQEPKRGGSVKHSDGTIG